MITKEPKKDCKIAKNRALSIQILGVRVNITSYDKVIAQVEEALVKSSRISFTFITTPNPEQIIQAQSDDYFRSILNQSTLSVPDGIGLIWGSKILKFKGKIKHSLSTRVSGVNLMLEIIRLCQKQGKSIFLLGGLDNSAQQAAKKILENHPTENFRVFYDSGPDFNDRSLNEGTKTAFKAISGARPDVVFVAFGAPKQEKWVWEHQSELFRAGVSVVMVVGGAFDMIAGKLKRAPLFWQKLGLEWLWRLLLQPWRWRRQVKLIEYARLILKS